MHLHSLLFISLLTLLSHLTAVTSAPIPFGNLDTAGKYLHQRFSEFREGPNYIVQVLCETEPGELNNSCTQTINATGGLPQTYRYKNGGHGVQWKFTWNHYQYFMRKRIYLPDGFITNNDKVSLKRLEGNPDGWQGWRLVFSPV